MKRLKKGLIGDIEFNSITAHQAYEHSRRDDLESLAYLLMSFLKGGKLPWSLTPPDHEPISIKDPYLPEKERK